MKTQNNTPTTNIHVSRKYIHALIDDLRNRDLLLLGEIQQMYPYLILFWLTLICVIFFQLYSLYNTVQGIIYTV